VSRMSLSPPLTRSEPAAVLAAVKDAARRSAMACGHP
jgi:hypothetical protein